jgi:ubiquinone/menaquinone biosynthesis C-methylase UbiE
MRKIKKYFFYALAVFLSWEIIFRILRKLFPFPAPSIIGPALDSNLRKILQPPDKLISRSGIEAGMKILEIGCGSGCFTTSAARRTGKSGEVNALDINSRMLDQLRRKLEKAINSDLKNIIIHRANAYELPFEDDSLDLVFMVTVFPEIPNKKKALAEIYRVLKPDGILALSEFLPDPDYLISSSTVKLVETNGFKLEKLSGNIWNYTARFRK